ncbi:FecR family protein [Methylopila henanensis]|uniref:FecR family protein n=1 Tax=Methylopila henanensis TaxID=873516 RepID=A0ABW4KAS0_9HYPH
MTDDAKNTLDALTEAALERIVHLHSGAAVAQDWEAYEDWKASSAERRAAAERAELLWARLGPALKPRRGGGTVAIFAALAIGLGGAFAVGAFGPPRAFFADERTSAGERRTISLADGSTVEADASTSFDVDLTPGERRLKLYSGRIHVAVSPDAARPFVVAAGDLEARALGTAFEVEHAYDVTSVLVTERRVRASDVRTGDQAELGEGEETEIRNGGLLAPRAVDVRAATAWRRGLLVFDDQPLDQVAHEVSRYVGGRIIVLGDAGRLRLTGAFPTNDAPALLDAIAAALPVHVTRLPFLTIVRSAAQ